VNDNDTTGPDQKSDTPKIVERREFLRRGVLTLGAGIVGLGGVRELFAGSPGLSARAWAAPSLADPFRIAVVGDSVAWGQALGEHNKYHTRVQNFLGARLNRPIEKQVVAHSGAVIAPSAEDAKTAVLSGEIPRKYPSITYQATAMVKDPASVSLVLLDGGINDVGALTMLNPVMSEEETKTRTLAVFHENHYVPFLQLMLRTFPNATIVLTNYFRVVSHVSDLAVVASLAAIFSPAAGLSSFVLRDNWNQRYRIFHWESTNAMQRSVAAIASPRLLFAPTGWDFNESVGAPNRMLWNPLEPDEVGRPRQTACDALYPEPRITNIDYLACFNASVAHPNVAGAGSYATRIIQTITPHVPSWTAPSTVVVPKAMTVSVVTGTSTLSAKTITVHAKDAATGQPLSGTVRINGVTGATGQPITFSACYTSETFEGPLGKPVTRRIRTPCEGSVTVSGYAEGAFSA
jgi:lysophospholipase L1-like esterase